MWNNTGFGDSRLEQNHTVLELWYQHVLDNPKFRPTDDHDCTIPDRSTKRHDPIVGCEQWMNYASVQGSLSSSFDRSMDNRNSISIFYQNSSGIIMVVVVLIAATVTLTRWNKRRRTAKHREYERLE